MQLVCVFYFFAFQYNFVLPSALNYDPLWYVAHSGEDVGFSQGP